MDSQTPTWVITFDPETTYEQAKKEAKKVRKMCGDWENIEQLAQSFRPAEPRISLPPQKPSIDLAKENLQLATELNHEYEIHREEPSSLRKRLNRPAMVKAGDN
jgi:hypothetical protein